MTTSTPTPDAGWYADPSGRHEYRLWDGTRWTDDVADAGTRGKDATTASPATAPASAAVGAGYAVIAVARWRVATVVLAGLGLVLVLMFEVLASMAAAGSTSGSSVSTVPDWLYWLYKPLDVSTTDGSGSTLVAYYGYPPVALWLGLVSAGVLMVQTQLYYLRALKKAGRRFRRLSSVREEGSRLRAALADRGCAKRYVFSVHQRALLLGSGIGSLVVALTSWYALAERSGAMLGHGQTVVSDLSVGLGPRLCLVAGVVGVLAAGAAWPWKPDREVVVHPDGSVTERSSAG